jgi:hypothetical protein
VHCARHYAVALAQRAAIPRWGDGRGASVVQPSAAAARRPSIGTAMTRMAGASLELLNSRHRFQNTHLSLAHICFPASFASRARVCLPPAVSQLGPHIFLASQTARCDFAQHQPGQSTPLPLPHQRARIPSSRLLQVVFADSSVAGLLIMAAFFMPIAWQSDSLQARNTPHAAAATNPFLYRWTCCISL